MCGAECREWVWVYIRSHARLKPYCVLNRDLMVRVYVNVLPRYWDCVVRCTGALLPMAPVFSV